MNRTDASPRGTPSFRAIVPVLAVFACFSSACSMFEQRGEFEVMPIAVGNRWTYVRTVDNVPTSISEWNMVRLERHGPATFGIVVRSEGPTFDSIVPTDSIMVINEAGLSLYHYDSVPSRLIAYYRYPIEPDEYFEVPGHPRICNEPVEGLTVPAGQFDVIRYRPCQPEETSAERVEISPGIGMIHRDLINEGWHLYEYQLVEPGP